MFAALSQLHDLVSIEKKLGDSLDIYIEAERARFDKIKRFSEMVKDAFEKGKLASGDKSLINSPGHTYGVIKRFVSGWTKLQGLLAEDYSTGIAFIAAQRTKQQFIFLTQEKSRFISLSPFAIRPQYLALLQP